MLLLYRLLSIAILGMRAAVGVHVERRALARQGDAEPSPCGPGVSVVGHTGMIFGCVDPASGDLLHIGGMLKGEGTGRTRRLSVDVRGSSSVDGCTEVVGSVRVSTSALRQHSVEASTDKTPMIVSTRNLRCGTDATWHPDATIRTVTVTDTYFFTAAPAGEGRQLPSLGWNAT
jgi:hypothetical protein